jgi:hypothetical protein
MSAPGPLVVLAAVITAIALPAVGSGANMNSTSANPHNTVHADGPANYLHLRSLATDPFGTTGYASRRGSSSSQVAATGMDTTLDVDLGGNKNANNRVFDRVFTLDAASPLPAGASPITVAVSLAPDPVSGAQPITAATLTDLAGAAAPASLTAGQRRQLNVTLNTMSLPANTLYAPTVTITVTFAGYSGSFLSYVVPVRVWTGNGAGP